MTKKPLTHDDLRQFTGTSQWFRTLMPGITYTEGVKYLAEQAGAYWLIDKISTLQLDSEVKKESFQVWKLRVAPTTKAALSCEDGNDNVVYREIIDFTDFPLAEIDVWFENNVIMLPSER